MLTACSNGTAENAKSLDQLKSQTSTPKNAQVHNRGVNLKELKLDSVMGAYGLIDPTKLNASIYCDLKYWSEDNFLKQRIYLKLNRPFLQKSVANRLAKCQEKLTAYDTSLHLLIYDAVRPLDIQYKMWKALDSIPDKRRVQFVSNPSHRSLHNYGAAVDLTICDSKNQPLDMGAAFDEFRPIAFPSLENEYFRKGLLSEKQLSNRKLLRRIMRSQGFVHLPTEWWHFNAFSIDYARKHFKVLQQEPKY